MTDAEDGEGHWLWRLDAAAWLDAARHEHAQLARTIAARRTAVAHARRAAGMALNAVLVAWSGVDAEVHAEVAAPWGRSYVEHLRRVAGGAHGPLDGAAVALARAILAVPGAAPTLVALGAQRHADLLALARDVEGFIDACAGTIARLDAPL